MRQKLNKTTVRNLETRANRYEVADTATPPFRIRVAPSGVKTFILRYRNAENRTRLFTIGKFGDLTPELAREIAQRKLAEIDLGNDPAAEKQEIRREAERQQYMTFGGFLEKKYGPRVTASRKSGHETLRMLNSRFAEFADKRLDEITPWLV